MQISQQACSGAVIWESLHCVGFSDGRLLDRRDRPKKGGDEVKYLYKEFVKHCPGLNADNAPHLFEYLIPAATADAEPAV